MDDAKNPALRELLAKPVAITLGDVTVEVRPMGWYQAADAIDKLLPALDAMPLRLVDGKPQAGEMPQWLQFAMDWRPEVLGFTVIASGLPEEVVRELPPAAMVELVIGLLELNADFFVRSLPALAARVSDRLVRMQGDLAAAMTATQAARTGFSTSSSG